MNAPDRIVDARGMLCPWPVLRLARAARELGGPGSVRILADDPVAPGEIEQLCREHGWSFSSDASDPEAFTIMVG